MKVEVYKLYDDRIKMLDTVSTPTVSYLSKYFKPNGKFDSGNTDSDGLSIANKFDSKGSEYDFGSKLSNVVLDYAGPEFVADTSRYTSFKENDKCTIKIKLEIADELGLDCEKFQIGFFYGTEDQKILYESKRVFQTDNVPEGDVNWDDQLNTEYDGPLSTVLDETGPDILDYDNEWFVYRKKSGNYMVDFNFNFTGDTTEGSVKMLYDDLDEGKYKTYEELNSGNLFIKLWDLAGNEYVFTGMKPLIIIPWTFEQFRDLLDPLSLYFYDTYPGNMFLPQDVIGKTSIVVENTNKVIARKYGLETVLKLDQDSVGYLVDYSKKVEDYDTYQDVDGIDEVGDVIAIAYLYGEIFDRETIAFLREATYTKGTLGPWVRECTDNTRKMNLDPYIPEFARETKFYEFCKFLEQFLNTAWCPMDKDCRIGLLEKISRIGNFNDIDTIEYPGVQFWAEDRGNELEFDKAAIDAIKSMSRKYHNLDSDGYACVRYLYKNLPYINLYKGTLDCFNVLFNSLGINAELIPLWGRNVGEGNEDWQPEYFYDRDKNNSKAWNKKITDAYYLSSHIELKVHGYLAYDLVDIAKSIVKLARSVLPVVRVIEYLLIEEFSLSSNYLSLGYINNSKELASESNIIQCQSMLWYTKDCSYKTVSEDEIELRIPQVSDRTSVVESSWWKGWNGSAEVNSYTHEGILVQNTPTRNSSKFFNMMAETLKKHKIYMYVDYSYYGTWVPLQTTNWSNQLKPLGVGKLEVNSISWDSGYMVIKVNSKCLDSIAQLDNATHISFTFIYNKATGLCYTTDLKTALATPKTTGELPGYKPYEWRKYKNEKI